jgi:hypothetical protein
MRQFSASLLSQGEPIGLCGQEAVTRSDIPIRKGESDAYDAGDKKAPDCDAVNGVLLRQEPGLFSDYRSAQFIGLLDRGIDPMP